MTETPPSPTQPPAPPDPTPPPPQWLPVGLLLLLALALLAGGSPALLPLAGVVTHKMYGRYAEGWFSATAARRSDWVADTYKTQLHTNAYTFDQDAHDFANDLTNELPTAGGYTAGGVTLAGKTLAYDTATNEVRLDANDAAWTGASFTARHAITLLDTAGASTTDPLASDVDFGGDETVASGNFTIQWDATGVMKVTVA